MMSGAVVTAKASTIGGSSREHTGSLHVARSAFFFEDGMRLRQAAAGVNALVAGNAVPDDPEEDEQGEGQA